jgi:hypothetical protein
MKSSFLSVTFFFLLLLCSCKNKTTITDNEDLYAKFKNPSREERPFVRWWWNGNKIKTEELDI